MGVQVIGIIRAGGIFTLAGARCSEVRKKRRIRIRETLAREREKEEKKLKEEEKVS